MTSRNEDLSFVYVNPVEKLAELVELDGIEESAKWKRITIWHRVEKRKISGFGAPVRKNLAKYVETHEDTEVFVGQDKWIENPGLVDPDTGLWISDSQRVALWNPIRKAKVSGRNAPLLRNFDSYLQTHPNAIIYRGQDFLAKAVKMYDEEERRCKNQQRKKNAIANISTLTNLQSCIRAAQRIDPAVSRFKRLHSRQISADFPMHINLKTHDLVPKSYWQERENRGSVNGINVKEVLSKMAENDAIDPTITVTDVTHPQEPRGILFEEQRHDLWKNMFNFPCPWGNPPSIYDARSERSVASFEDLTGGMDEIGNNCFDGSEDEIFQSSTQSYTSRMGNIREKGDIEMDFTEDVVGLDQIECTDDALQEFLASDGNSDEGSTI